MNRIIISDAAHAALMAQAIGEASKGKQVAGGKWDIEVDDEVLARLEAERLPGDTISDTLIRVCERHKTGGVN